MIHTGVDTNGQLLSVCSERCGNPNNDQTIVSIQPANAHSATYFGRGHRHTSAPGATSSGKKINSA